MSRRLGRIVVKEFLQLRRDRRMIPALIFGPLIQLLALGYAANSDVNDIPMLSVDLDRTAASRALIERFTGSGYFKQVGTEERVEDLDTWLIRGDAQMGLVIASGYGEAVASGREPRVQILVDGTDSSSAILGLGYATQILSTESLRRVQRRVQALAASSAPGELRRTAPGHIELVPRVWYNPDLKSRWFYVPAVLAMTLMLTTMILPSMAVVREKEIGTLEQIIVTPIRPWELMLGKLLPFALLGMLNLGLVTLLVVYLFGVPLRGDFGSLVALTLPFLMTTLGLGLLVSTLVRTQQQAMLTSMFFLMVPMIYLSGLIFPIENMPTPIRAVTYAIPLRYYSIIIRGVFLKGVGLETLWPEMSILCAFGATALLLASLRFRKRLD
ncbi:MAG: ABC transporter permease [Acidobacteria bacterium]|nr:MAG: ABC transporter permease [Acidobacteriota bacterium]